MGESGMGDSVDEHDAVAEETSTVTDTSTPSDLSIVGAFVRREIATAIITVSSVVLTLVMILILFGIMLVGGGFQAGYVAAIVDLLTPLQLLVPVVAIAFGYNAILGDQRRGGLDVLRTYPVSAWQVVVGVYLGRAIGVVMATGLPLVLLFVPIATSETPRLPGYASHTGADSPGLYLRLVVLTLLFALVVLALAVAISALVSTTRGAIAGAGVALVALVLVLDLAVVYGFSMGFVGDSGLVSSIAFSPLSGYRGLVIETSVVVTAGTGPRAAAPIPSLLSLLVWGLGSLAVATVAVSRS